MINDSGSWYVSELHDHKQVPLHVSIRDFPSLADGARGTDSPSFIGTMEALRLPSSFSLPSVSLGFNTAALLPYFFVRCGKQIPRNAWTVVHRSALHRSFARRREGLLPKRSLRDKFPWKPHAGLPCFQTPAVMQQLTLLTSLHCCSRLV